MISDDVNPIGCSMEYGLPSGHALYSSGFFTLVFLDYYHEGNKSHFYKALAVVSFIVMLIGFDRLYLGLHSID